MKTSKNSEYGIYGIQISCEILKIKNSYSGDILKNFKIRSLLVMTSNNDAMHSSTLKNKLLFSILFFFVNLNRK